MDKIWWTNNMACLFLCFLSLRFLSRGDIWSLLFMLQKSVTSRTCSNKYRMDFRLYTWDLEFSKGKGNHCSDLQCPALKIQVDTFSIFFYSEGHNSETVLQKAYALIIFFLLLWCRFTFCRFGHAFFVYPVFSVYGMHKKQFEIDWCSTAEWHTRSNANDTRLNSLTPPCPINDFW